MIYERGSVNVRIISIDITSGILSVWNWNFKHIERKFLGPQIWPLRAVEWDIARFYVGNSNEVEPHDSSVSMSQEASGKLKNTLQKIDIATKHGHIQKEWPFSNHQNNEQLVFMIHDPWQSTGVRLVVYYELNPPRRWAPASYK